MTDPVRVRRARIAQWVRLGLSAGYGLFLAAIVLFFLGLVIGYSDRIVSLIVSCLVAGSIVLAPSIVFNYAVRAAERDDVEKGPLMGTSSTPRLPAARRRRQLLDTARTVFAERGFHPTAMNDIADAAGVTKPVLYQHFASKRDLYREVLEDVGGRLEETIAKAAIGAPGPREQVEAGFGAYFRFVAMDQDAFQVLFGGDTRRDPEFARQAAATEASIAAAIACADRRRGHRPRPSGPPGPRPGRPGRGGEPAVAGRRAPPRTPTRWPVRSPSWRGPDSAASAAREPAGSLRILIRSGDETCRCTRDIS